MHWLAFNERETFSISKFSFVSKISLEKKRGSKGGTILAIGKRKKERIKISIEWRRKNRAYAKRENGRVNREIARHAQNSTARWNLNSVSGGVEFGLPPPSPFAFPRRFPPSYPPIIRHLSTLFLRDEARLILSLFRN